jgi:glycolate oxidase
MRFNPLESTQINSLRAEIPELEIHFDDQTRVDYGHDYTEDFSFPPDLVAKPRTTSEISKLLKWCNENRIPITPRGAGTGLSGAALAVERGVCLSMEYFNKIIQIDKANLQATVEPGVINQVFHDACKAEGLFYPPDPSSWGSSFLGGNLALNAGGPKAVKYGVTNAYVLNLEVVLPNGEIIWTGANTLKNSTGYNITQLMVGSEGTLGIITKAVFRLLPYPKLKMLMLVSFRSAEKACESVSAIFREGITPCAVEFMERDAIEYTQEFVKDAPIQLKPETQAHLLIEVDGNEQEQLFKDCERINEILEQFDADEILFAETEKEQAALWKLRRRVGEAVKSHSIYKEEDTVVPRAALATLLKGVKEIGKNYGFKSVCYGHAGDGNLHVNILKGDLTEEQWNVSLKRGIREIFELCVSLGGTLSGEHGVGWVQKEYLDIVFSPAAIEIQKAVKAAFDPNGILNPGKIFPD